MLAVEHARTQGERADPMTRPSSPSAASEKAAREACYTHYAGESIDECRSCQRIAAALSAASEEAERRARAECAKALCQRCKDGERLWYHEEDGDPKAGMWWHELGEAADIACGAFRIWSRWPPAPRPVEEGE